MNQTDKYFMVNALVALCARKTRPDLSEARHSELFMKYMDKKGSNLEGFIEHLKTVNA